MRVIFTITVHAPDGSVREPELASVMMALEDTAAEEWPAGRPNPNPPRCEVRVEA